jgi:hypothetical protein
MVCVTTETRRISYSKATGCFSAGKEAGGVKLNTRLYLVQRLRRSGAVPPLLHMGQFTFFTVTGKAKTKNSVRWLGGCRSLGWIANCKLLIHRTSNDGTTALFTAHQCAYTHSNQYRPSTRKVTRVKNSHLQFCYSSAQKMQRLKILQVCTSANVQANLRAPKLLSFK